MPYTVPDWLPADDDELARFEAMETRLAANGPPPKLADWRAKQQVGLDRESDAPLRRVIALVRADGAHRIVIVGTKAATLDQFRSRIQARLGPQITPGDRGDFEFADGTVIRFDHVGRGKGGINGFAPTVAIVDVNTPQGILRSLAPRVAELIPWT